MECEECCHVTIMWHHVTWTIPKMSREHIVNVIRMECVRSTCLLRVEDAGDNEKSRISGEGLLMMLQHQEPIMRSWQHLSKERCRQSSCWLLYVRLFLSLNSPLSKERWRRVRNHQRIYNILQTVHVRFGHRVPLEKFVKFAFPPPASQFSLASFRTVRAWSNRWLGSPCLQESTWDICGKSIRGTQRRCVYNIHPIRSHASLSDIASMLNVTPCRCVTYDNKRYAPVSRILNGSNPYFLNLELRVIAR